MTAVTWMTPALDVLVLTLLGGLLWRLRRDPAVAWQAHEVRLRELFERLRVLAAQSEGVARDLDGALGTHEERLRALLRDAAAVRPASDDHGRTSTSDHLVARVQRFAANAMPIEEIARRVDMPTAEVRVLIGLRRERASRARDQA